MMIDVEPDDRYARYEDPRGPPRPPVSAGYIADSGYSTAYLAGTQPPPPPGVEPRMDPRYIPQPTGNLTPPSGRTPGYQPQAYAPATTRASIPAIPAGGAFGDSRIRETGYGSYQPDPRARHR